MNEIKKRLEALLFSSPEPVSPRKLGEILGISPGDVRKLVEVLNQEYRDTGRSFTIKEVAGGFIMLTLPEYGELIEKLRGRRGKLSRSALLTLAIIAYRQPITKAEIDEIRGVDSGWVIRNLLDMGLIKVVGKKETVGRPSLYGTTDEFLKAFNLRSLQDLPPLEDETL
ncbi:SMC-Scp complex subunit ScpB [bacterium]|nr:MAG: SMC-Scp complex subunit ScpB [bacterium]RKZ22629.1 MAG: SMC-Scp complex subunit ScpB [bacterium]RKZ27153.1 MAG: SMC-Scp complex subunit ScpB [bacterium]